MNINFVDIVCGLNWGDEAKGKIVTHIVKYNHYDFVCRWAGGHNAGHTIYKEGTKYKTHLIPCGIFYGVSSIIGPDCVVHVESFFKEVEYLRENGFDTSLIKISPKAHIITQEHINIDIAKYKDQGTTSSGIAPCYSDKYARKGTRAYEVDSLKQYMWDEELWGNVLCEGAQGFWLDINYGNYPYVTSSTTLPYGACSLGFPPQKINKIIGASKIYDTRSGNDPLFPESLLDDPELLNLVNEGGEIGTTTGRIRKTNWLNLDKLTTSINISGVTEVILSKVDVFEKVGIFKLYYQNEILHFESFVHMKEFIQSILFTKCKILSNIMFSSNTEGI